MAAENFGNSDTYMRCRKNIQYRKEGCLCLRFTVILLCDNRGSGNSFDIISSDVAFETFLHFVVAQSLSYFQIIHVNKFHACLDLECVFCIKFLSVAGLPSSQLKVE